MFDRWTERARKVMSIARREAKRLRHHYLGTEHILLGLAKEGTGVAAVVLQRMGLDVQTLREAVERAVKPGPQPLPRDQELPYTPRAKRVLELALEEARRLHHQYVGTEHLLLGLLREEEGPAAEALADLNVTLDAARSEVHAFMAEHGGPQLQAKVRVEGEPPAASPPARKWEYKITELGDAACLSEEDTRKGLERRLNEMGEEGWEITGLQLETADGTKTIVAFAKREKQVQAGEDACEAL